MESWTDFLFLSRLQFAVATSFHIIWAASSVGLGALLLVLEALWLKTGDPAYYRHCRFWGKFFLVSFMFGVVTGLPLAFQFGTNWPGFAQAVGGFFGSVLFFEATLAFMLEAAFVGVMLLGWGRVSARAHFISTCLVVAGASWSVFLILAANSWMQTPAGVSLEGGRLVVTDYLAAVFNPDLFFGFTHKYAACLEAAGLAAAGLSAWYILRGRQVEFFHKSFRTALVGLLLLAPLQVLLGDGSGREITKYQPTKLAATEAHWETNKPGEGAGWKILAWPDEAREENVWSLEVPYGLSLLLTLSPFGQVRGLKDFPRDERPPVALTFFSFRIMMGLGFGLAGLALVSLWLWWRGGWKMEALTRRRWLLLAWAATIPLGYVALLTGWILREVGRQPWIVYGLMRTKEASADLPAAAAGTSLAVFVGVYVVLGLLAAAILGRLVQAGPDLGLEPPRPAGRS